MYGVDLYQDGCYWKIWCNDCTIYKDRSYRRARAKYEALTKDGYNKWAHAENQRLLNLNLLD